MPLKWLFPNKSLIYFLTTVGPIMAINRRAMNEIDLLGQVVGRSSLSLSTGCSTLCGRRRRFRRGGVDGGGGDQFTDTNLQIPIRKIRYRPLSVKYVLKTLRVETD